MPILHVEPLGVSIECAEDETLFAAARRQELLIPTACVGRGTCGLCRVKILEGEAHLSALNATEKRHLGNNYFITKLRLSCQAHIHGGDVRIRIPDARKPR